MKNIFPKKIQIFLFYSTFSLFLSFSLSFLHLPSFFSSLLSFFFFPFNSLSFPFFLERNDSYSSTIMKEGKEGRKEVERNEEREEGRKNYDCIHDIFLSFPPTFLPFFPPSLIPSSSPSLLLSFSTLLPKDQVIEFVRRKQRRREVAKEK